MAFPIAMVLAGAQFISSSYTQRENQRQQIAANRKFERLNLRFAGEDLVNNWAALNQRRIQESNLIASSLEEVSRDAARRIGAVRTSAGEAGVKGKSVQVLLRDFHANQLRTEQNLIDTNRAAESQFELEQRGLLSKYRERVLMGQQPAVPGPNYLQNLLDTTAMYLNLQGRMGNNTNTTNSSVPQLPKASQPQSSTGPWEYPDQSSLYGI